MVIGVLAQAETLIAVAHDWLPVLLVGCGTLALSMAAGLLLGRRPGVSPLTGMLALTAGGASGLVAVTRELGGDERIVAVIQYLRVVLVTVSMPVVAATIYGASGDGAAPAPGVVQPWYLGLLLTVVCAAVGVPLARRAAYPGGRAARADDRGAGAHAHRGRPRRGPARGAGRAGLRRDRVAGRRAVHPGEPARGGRAAARRPSH